MNPLERYLLDHSAPQSPLLDEVERFTHLHTCSPQMLSGPTVGALLALLVRLTGARRVLEIGTFTGYSALWMAAALPEGGVLDTVEADDEREDSIRTHFARSPHAARIRLHIGSALRLVPSLAGPYDLVYIDGDKREYPAYYRMLMGDDGNAACVRSGSLLVADNVLWYGKVADRVNRDAHTEALRSFNRTVHLDSRTENLILPVQDGLHLIRVNHLTPNPDSL